jgi:hypothetical protein
MASSSDSTSQNSTSDKNVEYTMKINKDVSYVLQINPNKKEITFNI